MIPFAQSGVLVGNWEYIWAAYGMTWLTLGAYGIWVMMHGGGTIGDTTKRVVDGVLDSTLFLVARKLLSLFR